jgi:hypothetical protein
MAKLQLSQIDGAESILILAHQNGINRTNTGAANKAILQALIDANTVVGATIYFTEPVPMGGGITLKPNIHLAGNNTNAYKGSVPFGGAPNSLTAIPSGAAFLVTDTVNVFITVKSNISIDGIIFDYPAQAYAATNPANIVTYPVTIQKAAGEQVCSCSFTRLSFVGCTWVFDFYSTSTAELWIQDLTFDQIYAYPLSGIFIKMIFCVDIPRFTRIMITPGAGTNYRGNVTSNNQPVTGEIIDNVLFNGSPTFDLERCDEFMMSQCFCFGIRTAFRFLTSYGTLANCNADMVETGVWFSAGSQEYKYLSLLSFSCALGGGILANRNVIVFAGDGGKVFATNLQGVIGSNPVVPSAMTAGANAMIKIIGTGQQKITLLGARSCSANAGVWTKFIDNQNASAIISYPDSDQQAVTTPSNTGQLKNTVLNAPGLEGLTVDPIGATVATNTISIPVNGVIKKFLVST